MGKECACGCGEDVHSPKAMYIQGHNLHPAIGKDVGWTKGKKRSKRQSRLHSKLMKELYKDEPWRKEAHSQLMKENYEDGLEPWNKGLTKKDRRVKNYHDRSVKTRKTSGWSMPKDARKRISKTLRKPEHRERLRLNRAKQLRSKRPTDIECIMGLLLKMMDFRFEEQKLFSYKDHTYIADFVLLDIPVVIECDGEYWHQGIVARIRDRVKDHMYKVNGYEVLRFTGKEIYNCLKVIMILSKLARRIRRGHTLGFIRHAG